jgi:alpha-methylacyl-CoA racemase
MLLADFGAEVLKVEDTGMGDYVRWSPPHYEGAERSAASALFLALNRGKRSLRLNLKEQAGREVLLRLVREYDVLVESFRPGVMDRLGVGYERLRRENPRLVYCAITGYGQTGPLRDRPGHDMDYLALNGILGLTGDKDGPPVQAAVQIADIGGGSLMAAFGIMAALWERERSGEGQFVDVSMTDGALSWLAMVAARYFCDGQEPRRGLLELAGGLVCYRPYPCKDGWVALGALEPKFWQAFCRGIGREDLIERQFDGPTPRRGASSSGSSRSARARSGRSSVPSTTAASSRCSSSAKRCRRSSFASARWSSRSNNRGPVRCVCLASR